MVDFGGKIAVKFQYDKRVEKFHWKLHHILTARKEICHLQELTLGACPAKQLLEAKRPTQNPKIPKKSTAFTRTFSKSSRELLPSSL